MKIFLPDLKSMRINCRATHILKFTVRLPCGRLDSKIEDKNLI